jgi:hypothetical protein
MNTPTTELDSSVKAVIEKFKQRAVLGKQKYGTDLDRQDLQVKDWIQHAQEELMDGILYLEKLKQSLQPKPAQYDPNAVVDPHWGC